jgi:ubiquinone/menaquinone biosynthesis C-methylase UbiE
MKLNALEFQLMNNPLRRLVQEYYEMKRFLALDASAATGRVLEIGCGSGNGTRLIQKYLRPERIDAIDLDERMIEIARRKNIKGSNSFSIMDASHLEFPDESFDTVFDFGIIHHVPNWRDCVNELFRVLRPGGVLMAEELSAESFKRIPGRLWKALSDHPYEEMFSREQFMEQLIVSGFIILKTVEANPLGLLKHFALQARKGETYASWRLMKMN